MKTGPHRSDWKVLKKAVRVNLFLSANPTNKIAWKTSQICYENIATNLLLISKSKKNPQTSIEIPTFCFILPNKVDYYRRNALSLPEIKKTPLLTKFRSPLSHIILN